VKLSGLKIVLGISIVAFLSSCLGFADEPVVSSQRAEQAELTAFLNKLTESGKDIDTTSFGIYYINMEEGEGEFPKAGDSLEVGYVGYFIDGTLFDASDKMEENVILLDHGSGGKIAHRLTTDLLLPALDNPFLAQLNDGAVLEVDGCRLAFSTDTFTVDPIFFPGGDIGELAVNGTVNDLAMCGARPLYLSLALIMEEGLLLDDLKKIMDTGKVDKWVGYLGLRE